MEAVVFDFDGLIVDTESVWYDAFRQVFRNLDYGLTIDEFALCIGTSDDVLFEHLKKNVSFTKEAVIKEAESIYKDRLQGLKLRDGVLEYISSAKKLGLKIGLASSSNRNWVEGFLERFEIKDYFDVIKTADDVVNIKPDPELYLAAIKDLGAAPERIIAFEDSQNGLRAALAAGLNVVVVPNKVTGHLNFEGHKLRLNSMADLPLEDLILSISSSGEKLIRG
ncbi:HAD family hydrolase [Siminovitchia fortis]|uniref:HAD family hydrolase n=1 Tax=Siminovitchia fortis TaxID=254758 RepID=A0A443IYT4_9BACI|nr:HAD family hydrolase [Siminovitchia fortis]RWR13223.1 HAD family hydrolase [Siminovitchia fortis]WHY83609.1 HAD family hydrolase [Siminovitchia fortis]